MNEKVRLQEEKKRNSKLSGFLTRKALNLHFQGKQELMMEIKKVKGRKRHFLVDTLGLLLAVHVHAANIHDTKAAEIVMKKGLEVYPS